MAHLETLPIEIRDHIANHLPSMDMFAAAEATPKMEEVLKVQVAPGTDFQIDFSKSVLVIALAEMDCWSATSKALGERLNGWVGQNHP